MAVEVMIKQQIDSQRCICCGRRVKVGNHDTLGFWGRMGKFTLVCLRCEADPAIMDIMKTHRHTRV